MSDELRTVLRLVAEGHLSPEEAAPIVEALSADAPGAAASGRRPERGPFPGDDADQRVEARTAAAFGDTGRAAGQVRRGRQLRIRVTERGRQVVNLNIPLGFADRALRMVPGIGEEESDRIRAAIESGAIGPIIDVEDAEGDGVLISID